MISIVVVKAATRERARGKRWDIMEAAVVLLTSLYALYSSSEL